MTAPSLVALAGVISSFTTLYMGIGQPQRDNAFVHKQPNHKFITRRNKVGTNSWDTRFAMKLEVIGVATDAVQQFVRLVMTNHCRNLSHFYMYFMCFFHGIYVTCLFVYIYIIAAI